MKLMALKTEEDAGNAMRALRAARVKVAAARKRYDEAMSQALAKATAALEQETATWALQEEALTAALERWARAERLTWGEARSVKLAGGTIGFRQGKDKLLIADDKAGERVMELIGKEYVEVAVKPKIAEIKKLDLKKEDLARMGLELKPGEDKFYAET